MRAILVDRNRFYADRLKSARAFEEIPFTTKAELVEDQAKNPPFGTNLTFPIESYVRIHRTSGTAGRPLLWLDTIESWDWWLRCWAEVYKGAGMRAGDRVFVAFSFAPFIGFWTAFEAAQRMGVMVISGGGQSTEQRLHAIFERQATVLVCTPTYALRLAGAARQQGLNLTESSIRITIHAGEPGASIPATRQRIEEAFGARTFDHVGMTEMGAYGFECEAQSGIHINEDEFIVEMIEGEVVLTNLGRIGMPLIRYRTGDLGVISREPCVCGRRSARLIGGIRGRADDMITIRGVNVFPSAIENIVRRHREIVEFAIEVFREREMDELALKVEVENGAVIGKLRQEILTDLHIRARIQQVPSGSLPRFELKSKRVLLITTPGPS